MKFNVKSVFRFFEKKCKKSYCICNLLQSLCWQSRISEEWSFFLEESLKAAPSLKFRSQFLISHTATSESPIFSIHESSGDVSQSPLARDCPETGSTGLGPNVDQSSLFARPPDFFYSKVSAGKIHHVQFIMRKKR